MHLIEIFLPLNDNDGRPFGARSYAAVRKHLTECFGGLTELGRSPAQGISADGGKKVRDDIIVFEVMAKDLDPVWWRSCRLHLEEKFCQDEIVVRASAVMIL